MKKATLRAAGTAVLGVALAAAGAGTAMADGVGDSLGPAGQVDGLANGPILQGAHTLTSPDSLKQVTTTASGVLSQAKPDIRSMPADSPLPVNSLPVNALPGAGGATSALQGGLGSATQGLGALPVKTPLG